MSQPNLVVVFADQWRAQATGYAGNPNVRTPNIDALAESSVNFSCAISSCPVCSPYRASLLTGQNPLTHGVFVNDVCLRPSGPSIAQAFAAGGYKTAYIGKWHVDGHGRSSPIPPRRQLGFDYWKVLECTHDYQHSAYYEWDSTEKQYWNGYDAIAQTRDAQAYIRQHADGEPFFLMLSWGPPHNPYETAPEEFRAMYHADDIVLRPNVPASQADKAREDLAGYYSHCSALDLCVGDLLATLDDCGISRDTIVLFTSDHGDMLYSQDQARKQKPWNESIRVPFLLRWPGMKNWKPQTKTAPIDAPDVMPTLLSLCGLDIPDSVEGLDFSAHIAGGDDPSGGEAMLMCPHPFGEWARPKGGMEYRGIVNDRYTYARTRQGPWLLYDNCDDPYQLTNLIDNPDYATMQAQLDQRLSERLAARGDEFKSGMDYIRQWGYVVDERGTVPIVE